MNVAPLFSIPCATDTLDEIDHDSILERLKSLDYKMVSVNNAMIQEPRDSSFGPDQLLEDELFSDLKNSILIHFHRFIDEVLQFDDIAFYINCSWVNLHRTGHWGHQHYHANALYSCVYYPHDVEDNQGDLRFSAPDAINTYISSAVDPRIKEYNILNSKEWKFRPKKGEIYFFPAHLTHSTGVNESDVDRYSIACNFWIKNYNDNRRSKCIYI